MPVWRRLRRQPVTLEEKIAEAKHRYANARRRARYWSGTPNFNRALRSNETRTSETSLKYELAMCDCKSWESTLSGLTGKEFPHYDPRSEFQRAFTKLLCKMSPVKTPQPVAPAAGSEPKKRQSRK